MRNARRHEHEITRLGPQNPIAGPDLELALDDVEDLLDLAVDVVAGIETGCSGEFEEGWPAGGTLSLCFVRHLRAAQRERLALTGLDNDRVCRHGDSPSGTAARRSSRLPRFRRAEPKWPAAPAFTEHSRSLRRLSSSNRLRRVSWEGFNGSITTGYTGVSANSATAAGFNDFAR